jgi:stage II sporulation protein AA (anti-sigma F factor antagonist)
VDTATGGPQPEARRTAEVEGGFSIDLERDGDGWRIVLSGDIDVAADAHVRAALGRALARTGSHLVIDLSKTTFLDSTGLNDLVLAHKAAQAASVRLVVEPGPPSIMRTLRIAGIDWLLGLGD